LLPVHVLVRRSLKADESAMGGQFGTNARSSCEGGSTHRHAMRSAVLPTLCASRDPIGTARKVNAG
jgi:hypothetical protein